MTCEKVLFLSMAVAIASATESSDRWRCAVACELTPDTATDTVCEWRVPASTVAGTSEAGVDGAIAQPLRAAAAMTRAGAATRCRQVLSWMFMRSLGGFCGDEGGHD